MSFKEFVKQARVTNTIPGDLVADLKTDSRLPDDIDSLERLRSYMGFRGACDEAMRVTRPVWKRYERWVAQQDN